MYESSIYMNITELKGKHDGEDIYVIASGKSLDFIDPSFFDGKITVGINQVYKRVKTTYLVRKETSLLEESLATNPEVIHIVSDGDCGSLNGKNRAVVVSKKIPNAYIFRHLQNVHNYISLPEDENLITVSWSTITSGIHIACYLGAKNVIIVGHDCGTINGEANFTGYHTKKSMVQNNEAEYVNWLKQIESHTVKLKADLIARYGCNILSLNPFVNFGLEGNVYKK